MKKTILLSMLSSTLLLADYSNCLDGIEEYQEIEGKGYCLRAPNVEEKFYTCEEIENEYNAQITDDSLKITATEIDNDYCKIEGTAFKAEILNVKEVCPLGSTPSGLNECVKQVQKVVDSSGFDIETDADGNVTFAGLPLDRFEGVTYKNEIKYPYSREEEIDIGTAKIKKYGTWGLWEEKEYVTDYSNILITDEVLEDAKNSFATYNQHGFKVKTLCGSEYDATTYNLTSGDFKAGFFKFGHYIDGNDWKIEFKSNAKNLLGNLEDKTTWENSKTFFFNPYSEHPAIKFKPVDSWDKLPMRTDIETNAVAENPWLEQKYTRNSVWAKTWDSVNVGSLAKAENPFIDSVGYNIFMEQSLEQMNVGGLEKYSSVLAELGYCYIKNSAPSSTLTTNARTNGCYATPVKSGGVFKINTKVNNFTVSQPTFTGSDGLGTKKYVKKTSTTKTIDLTCDVKVLESTCKVCDALNTCTTTTISDRYFTTSDYYATNYPTTYQICEADDPYLGTATVSNTYVATGETVYKEQDYNYQEWDVYGTQQITAQMYKPEIDMSGCNPAVYNTYATLASGEYPTLEQYCREDLGSYDAWEKEEGLATVLKGNPRTVEAEYKKNDTWAEVPDYCSDEGLTTCVYSDYYWSKFIEAHPTTYAKELCIFPGYNSPNAYPYAPKMSVYAWDSDYTAKLGSEEYLDMDIIKDFGVFPIKASTFWIYNFGGALDKYNQCQKGTVDIPADYDGYGFIGDSEFLPSSFCEEEIKSCKDLSIAFNGEYDSDCDGIADNMDTEFACSGSCVADPENPGTCYVPTEDPVESTGGSGTTNPPAQSTTIPVGNSGSKTSIYPTLNSDVYY